VKDAASTAATSAAFGVFCRCRIRRSICFGSMAPRTAAETYSSSHGPEIPA
jgi:hypothetical protein